MFKLKKPYSDNEKADFVVLHEYENNRKIVETKECIFALEADELLDGENVVKDKDYKYKKQAQERERINRLKITKYDFYKYVCLPFGVDYPKLQEFVKSNSAIQAAWELCAMVYRGDEILCASIPKFIPKITSEKLDEVFKKYGVE